MAWVVWMARGGWMEGIRGGLLGFPDAPCQVDDLETSFSVAMDRYRVGMPCWLRGGPTKPKSALGDGDITFSSSIYARRLA